MQRIMAQYCCSYQMCDLMSEDREHKCAAKNKTF